MCCSHKRLRLIDNTGLSEKRDSSVWKVTHVPIGLLPSRARLRFTEQVKHRQKSVSIKRIASISHRITIPWLNKLASTLFNGDFLSEKRDQLTQYTGSCRDVDGNVGRRWRLAAPFLYQCT
jgi:hypothetical protein